MRKNVTAFARHAATMYAATWCAALALGSSAHAASLTYTNVDVAIISSDLDDADLSGSGVLVRGSYEFYENFFAHALVSDIGYDHSVDGFLWGIGAGGHWPITSALDLVGKLTFLHQDLDFRGGNNSESGYALEATARGFVVDKLEVEGGVRHSHLEDTGNNSGLIGEARYFFTPRIAGGVLVQVGDDTTFGANVRFTF